MLFLLIISFFQLNATEDDLLIKYFSFYQMKWIREDTININQYFGTFGLSADIEYANLKPPKLMKRWIEFDEKYHDNIRDYVTRENRGRIVCYNIDNQNYYPGLNRDFLKDEVFQLEKERILSFDYDTNELRIYDEDFKEIYKIGIKKIKKHLEIPENLESIELEYVDKNYAYFALYDVRFIIQILIKYPTDKMKIIDTSKKLGIFKSADSESSRVLFINGEKNKLWQYDPGTDQITGVALPADFNFYRCRKIQMMGNRIFFLPNCENVERYNLMIYNIRTKELTKFAGKIENFYLHKNYIVTEVRANQKNFSEFSLIDFNNKLIWSKKYPDTHNREIIFSPSGKRMAIIDRFTRMIEIIDIPMKVEPQNP